MNTKLDPSGRDVAFAFAFHPNVVLLQASPDQMEARLDNGLIIGHAYSITSVKMVSLIIQCVGFPLLFV